MKSVSIPAWGGSILTPKAPKPYDVDCYFMRPSGREGFNYWKRNCEMRYSIPENRKTCMPDCRYDAASPNYNPDAMPATLSPTEKGLMYLKYHKEGMSHQDIADMFGISKSSVTKYIHLVNEDRKKYKPKIPQEMIDEWKRLRTEKGWTHDEIAEAYGYHKSTIVRYVPYNRGAGRSLTVSEARRAKHIADLKDNKGWTFADIQKKYKMTRYAVRKALFTGRILNERKKK